MKFNYKYIMFFLIICLFIMLENVSAINPICTYMDGDEKFNTTIYLEEIDGDYCYSKEDEENRNLKCFFKNSSKIQYYNNTEYGGTEEYLKTSAVDYYKEYDTCPPYFVIEESGIGWDDGFFSEKNTSIFGTVYPLFVNDYSEDLVLEDEILDFTLYSTDVKFSSFSLQISINYTDKEIVFQNSINETEKNKIISNFNFEDKSCPINKIKLCSDIDFYWIYDASSEEGIGSCTILDTCEQNEVGNSYCGVFKKYIDATDEQTKKTYKAVISSYCKSLLSNVNYDETKFNNKYSCENMCLSASEYIDNDTGQIDDCVFSDKLINWVANIVRWGKYLIPVAVIILSILDFIKAVGADKEDEMKKAQKKFVTRLIAAALIFILPFIIEFVLTRFGFNYNGCGIIDL